MSICTKELKLIFIYLREICPTLIRTMVIMERQLKHREKRFIKGEAWCLLDSVWFEHFKRWARNIDLNPPGPIDNKLLFKEDGREIRDWVEGLDHDTQQFWADSGSRSNQGTIFLLVG